MSRISFYPQNVNEITRLNSSRTDEDEELDSSAVPSIRTIIQRKLVWEQKFIQNDDSLHIVSDNNQFQE